MNRIDIEDVYFQQDSATCHTTRHNIDKNNIIGEINASMLESVSENFDHRIDINKTNRGEHLADIINVIHQC